MHRRLPLLIRAIAYGLRGGFLIRPFIIALALGAAGGSAVLTGRTGADAHRVDSRATLFPCATGPAGGTGDPERHCNLDHDRRLHRICHPADDADIGLDAIFTSAFWWASCATVARNGHWGCPRHLFVLHRRAAGSALAACRVRPVLTVTGAMLLALVAVRWLMFSSIASRGDRRQPHRRSHRAGDRACYRRIDHRDHERGSNR